MLGICRRDDNGKTKERIAQEDISNNTVGGTGSTAGQVGPHLQRWDMHVHEQGAGMKWHAEISAVFDGPVLSSVQAVAVLQEVESSTPGNKLQIVFERQADIRPEALAELIEQARFAALRLSTLSNVSTTARS